MPLAILAALLQSARALEAGRLSNAVQAEETRLGARIDMAIFAVRGGARWDKKKGGANGSKISLITASAKYVYGVVAKVFGEMLVIAQ